MDYLTVSKKRRKRRRADDTSDAEVEPSHVSKSTTASDNTTKKTDNHDEEANQVKDANSNISNKSKQRHNFETFALDHCETPREAYHHLQPFLDAIAQKLNIQPTPQLRIWDPFYCDGSTKRILEEDLGFVHVYHENQDFYKLIQNEKTIPPHDILITNPPYIDDHIPRLLQFVVKRQLPHKIPCCLLLPNWVSRQKDYSQNFVKPLAALGAELFHLAPLKAYTYTMPSWVGDNERPNHVTDSGQTTPYLSSWYLAVPSTNSSSRSSITNNKKTSQLSSLLEQMDAVAKRQSPSVWIVAKTVKGLKWKMQKLQQKSRIYKNGVSGDNSISKKKRHRRQGSH